MRLHWIHPALVVSSLMASSAFAADFLFGEDFEGVPACNGAGFVIAATPATRSTTLGTQSRYFVKTRACGVSGTVTLGQSGAPVSWITTLDPTSQTLASDAVGVALLTVTVPTNGDAGLAMIDLAATNNAVTVHGNASLDVANEYLLHFAPDGTDTGPHAFPPSLTIRVGATLRLLDDDTTQHQIHADSAAGFTHQGAPMNAGQEYDITPTEAGSTGRIYCHIHDTGTGVTMVHVNP